MKKLKDVEVELKFPLKNHQKLVKKLNKIAKTKRKKEYQKDTYFIPAHNDFLKQDPVADWLRVRESEKGTAVNFKHWYYLKDRTSTHCDEFETKIENADSLKKIFQSLDFKEAIVVEKIRNTWDYQMVEIAVDFVTDLGAFIELEANGDFESIEQARKHLYSILEKLEAEVGEQDYLGYPYRLIEKKKI